MAHLTIEQTLNLALKHHRSGQMAQAEQMYRQVLARRPNHPEALHLLGVVALQAGRHDAAADLIARAVAPNDATMHYNLGNALSGAGRPEQAIASYRQAIALKKDFAEAYYNLGNALQDQGRLDEAIAAFRQALALKPHLPEALCNLGNALLATGQVDEAIAACRQVIALRPAFAQAHHNLANALKRQGQLDQAVAAYKQAIALRPDFSNAHCNLGNVLKDQGRLDEALASYRQALDSPAAQSNLLYTLHFHPGYDAAAIAAEHRRWNQVYAQPLAAQIRPHPQDRSPERRLRIGYVSPDLYNHVAAQLLLPLFRHHRHDLFEIFCYASVLRPDAVTQTLQGLSDTWRSVVGHSDAGLAELVRQDRIDILVDLSVHMGGNRLLVFARKPAPVQVTYLGYPGSTGLSTIDYRLTDPYLDPPGLNDAFYSEQSFRLPHTFWCYDPPSDQPPVNALPALNQDHLTFACLNNFCKINEPTLRLWSRVLRAVERSRLLLLTVPGSHRQHALDLLQQEGITTERVEFLVPRQRAQYLELYHGVDVALDSFPYNGHTTSLDAYWMGVPVVTLVGQTAVSRAGWSQLSNLHLTDLAATTADQFVQIAANLAADLPRLAFLRADLRQRMQRSPLMDPPAFAADIEAAYRQMWHNQPVA